MLRYKNLILPILLITTNTTTPRQPSNKEIAIYTCAGFVGFISGKKLIESGLESIKQLKENNSNLTATKKAYKAAESISYLSTGSILCGFTAWHNSMALIFTIKNIAENKFILVAKDNAVKVISAAKDKGNEIALLVKTNGNKFILVAKDNVFKVISAAKDKGNEIALLVKTNGNKFISAAKDNGSKVVALIKR